MMNMIIKGPNGPIKLGEYISTIYVKMLAWHMVRYVLSYVLKEQQ